MKSLLFAALFAAFQLCNAAGVYKVGVGIADVTGPAAEINMVNPFTKNKTLVKLKNNSLDGFRKA